MNEPQYVMAKCPTCRVITEYMVLGDSIYCRRCELWSSISPVGESFPPELGINRASLAQCSVDGDWEEEDDEDEWDDEDWDDDLEDEDWDDDLDDDDDLDADDEDEEFEQDSRDEPVVLTQVPNPAASTAATGGAPEEAAAPSSQLHAAAQPIQIVQTSPYLLEEQGDGTWQFNFIVNEAPSAAWLTVWTRRRFGALRTQFISTYLELYCRPEDLEAEFAKLKRDIIATNFECVFTTPEGREVEAGRLVKALRVE